MCPWTVGENTLLKCIGALKRVGKGVTPGVVDRAADYGHKGPGFES